MKIVGCDLHTRYQQIAMLDEETGEVVERRLEHESGEARRFYAGLTGAVPAGGPPSFLKIKTNRGWPIPAHFAGVGLPLHSTGSHSELTPRQQS